MPTAQDGEKGMHTETPWSVASKGSHLEITDGLKVIARVWNKDDRGNANFIVRAANAFEDLLSAVSHGLENCPHSYGVPCSYCKVFEAAIAKVEGRES